MLAQRLIERKRDGGRLSAPEWEALAHAFASGSMTEYQMAAFLMAAFIRGLDRDEVGALTQTMLDSGQSLDLSHLAAGRIDKHSTGGVGDKVSLILAPLVTSLGLVVPMMSGRGLGHTGGTLDKLESISGFQTRLSLEHARRQLEDIGCALIGQSRARELFLTAQPVDAARALGWGLVDHLVAVGDVLPTALRLADAMASGVRGAVRATRGLFEQILPPLPDGIVEAVQAEQARVWGSDEAVAARAAFRKK